MAHCETSHISNNLVQALHSRYGDTSFEETCDFVICLKSKRFESGVLLAPSTVVLTDYNISNAGDEVELRQLCVNVVDLSLAKNKLSDWFELVKIIEQMPKLRTLNVASNPLCERFPDELTCKRFDSLQHLVLNDTRVTWQAIEAMLKILPKVSELHLSLNNYTSIDCDGAITYPSLRQLHFNRNLVTDWRELSKLGHSFPNLEALVLMETAISCFGRDADVCKDFQNLTYLSLNKAMLNDWSEIDKLRLFPNLTKVGLLDIKLFEKYTKKNCWQMAIARLPNLTHLNRSLICDNEREDAERAFVRFYMDLENKPQRYYELEALYGRLDPLVELNLSPQTKYKVKLKFGDKEEEMEINSKQTVSQFKKLLQNFVGKHHSCFRLFYFDSGTNIGPEELRFPNKFLYSLNIHDDDEFHIWLK